jgi:hypothetical protein
MALFRSNIPFPIPHLKTVRFGRGDTSLAVPRGTPPSPHTPGSSPPPSVGSTSRVGNIRSPQKEGQAHQLVHVSIRCIRMLFFPFFSAFLKQVSSRHMLGLTVLKSASFKWTGCNQRSPPHPGDGTHFSGVSPARGVASGEDNARVE